VKTFPEAALRLMEAAVAGEQVARKIQVAHGVECWCDRCEKEANITPTRGGFTPRPQPRRNPVFRRILSVALVVAVTLAAQRNWDWIEAKAVQCGLRLYDRYFGVPPTGNLARTLLELMSRTDAWYLSPKDDATVRSHSGIAVHGDVIALGTGSLDTDKFTEDELTQIRAAYQRLHADLIERRNNALAQRIAADFRGEPRVEVIKVPPHEVPAGEPTSLRQTLPNVAPPVSVQYVLPTYYTTVDRKGEK
jgi:hypothetical protein